MNNFRKTILAAAMAFAVPAAAHAEGEIKELTLDVARFALKYKHVSCDESGLLQKGDRILITCTNGQGYAVIVVREKGKEDYYSVQRFNQLTNQFWPI